MREPRTKLPKSPADECDWKKCDEEPEYMTTYEEPEDYVFYCENHHHKAKGATDSERHVKDTEL